MIAPALFFSYKGADNAERAINIFHRLYGSHDPPKKRFQDQLTSGQKKVCYNKQRCLFRGKELIRYGYT